MEKIFYFDLETTGTKYWRNGIHQISGLIEIDGEVKEEFDFHVQPNPNAEIDPEALKVGGVTLEQIMAYPPMSEIHEKLKYMLNKYVDKYNKKDKFFLCGYNNAPFDNPFLRAFFVQNGDNFFGSYFWPGGIDVMVLALDFLKHRRADMNNFKLMTVAEEMGIRIEEEKLHNATYDIYLTREIYRRIKNVR